MSDVRVRRHTDGRVAVKLAAGPWHMVYGWLSEQYPSQDEINGSGEWSELLVAELPEPDDVLPITDAPCWDTTYIGPLVVENGAISDPSLGSDFGKDGEALRSDALKMLAAVAACERYRAEQET